MVQSGATTEEHPQYMFATSDCGGRLHLLSQTEQYIRTNYGDQQTSLSVKNLAWSITFRRIPRIQSVDVEHLLAILAEALHKK